MVLTSIDIDLSFALHVLRLWRIDVIVHLRITVIACSGCDVSDCGLCSQVVTYHHQYAVIVHLRLSVIAHHDIHRRWRLWKW